MAEEAYGVGQFQKSNYVVSVSTSNSGKPGVSRVSIFNLGNVRPTKLPVVKGAKSLFANETLAMYATDMKVADVVNSTRKLLLDAGWEPLTRSASTSRKPMRSLRSRRVMPTIRRVRRTRLSIPRNCEGRT